MPRTTILLFGATGRMGRAIRACVAEFPEISLAACIARSSDGECPPGCAWLTPEALFASDAELPGEAVLIDVSLAAGTARLLDWLERAPRRFLSATTGLSESDERRVAALGGRMAVLRARNLSVGSSVASAMLRAVPEGATKLFEVDITEHHHAAKRDQPSGTALAWGDLLKRQTGKRVGAEVAKGAGAAGASVERRPPGEIRYHSIRSGTAVGTHRVLFAGAGETLELVHTVAERSVFARGALRAATFLSGQTPGLYTFDQVIAAT